MPDRTGSDQGKSPVPTKMPVQQERTRPNSSRYGAVSSRHPVPGTVVAYLIRSCFVITFWILPVYRGGFGMSPWCIVLVCSRRRLLAGRHSLPFPWTLSLRRRWCPSAGGGGVRAWSIRSGKFRCRKFRGSRWILCAQCRSQFEMRNFPHETYCPRNPQHPLYLISVTV